MPNMNNNIDNKKIEEMTEQELMKLAATVYRHCRRLFGKLLKADGTPALNYAEYLQDKYNSEKIAVQECLGYWYINMAELLKKHQPQTVSEEHYYSVIGMCNAIRKQARFELNKGATFGKTDDIRYNELLVAIGCEEVDAGLLEEDARATLRKAFSNVAGFKGSLIIEEKLSEPEVSTIELSRRLKMSEKTITAIIKQAKDEYYKLISM